MRRQSPTAAMIDQMVALYQAGYSLAKIGHILKVDGGTVHNHLRAYGVQMRDPHGRERAL
ncbi:hypothetical protein [Jatrophihabitans sp. GAS493]|uniref:hypothetical protein n=1 Tax=Jatrophihabitans sp. GAS493 TaxID=1907575 RepID=UPI0012FDDC4B|nr:hypothetical protein [Jatrophihabitans sp. GAS493]